MVSFAPFADSRSALVSALPRGGGFVCPCWFSFGVGFGPSRLALVFVVCGGFVLFFRLFGASRWSAEAKNWEVFVVK